MSSVFSTEYLGEVGTIFKKFCCVYINIIVIKITFSFSVFVCIYIK